MRMPFFNCLQRDTDASVREVPLPLVMRTDFRISCVCDTISRRHAGGYLRIARSMLVDLADVID